MAIANPRRKLKRRKPNPLGYVNRNVEGGVFDFEFLDFYANTHSPLLIEGPTGCGKTMAINSWALARGRRFASISCNVGVDPSQFFGRVIPLEDGSFAWQDGVVTDFVRHGGALLFNEVNFLPDRVSTALFSLFDSRRTITLLDHKGEQIVAHTDLVLFSDMNPGYAGTRPLNAAFRNRHTIQSKWDYDTAVEKRLVPETLVQWATAARNSNVFKTPIATNMLQEFVANGKSLGAEFAKEIFANHFADTERLAILQLFRDRRNLIDALFANDAFEIFEGAEAAQDGVTK